MSEPKTKGTIVQIDPKGSDEELDRQLDAVLDALGLGEDDDEEEETEDTEE